MPVQQRLPLVGDADADAGHGPGPAPDDDWRIDEPTRLAGRRGVAAARAALARSASDASGRQADAA